MKKRYRKFSILFGILVLTIIVYNLFIDSQQLIKLNCKNIAIHAAQSADAFRVLSKEPQNQYERYRALFHLRNLYREANSIATFSNSQAVYFDNTQELVSGQFDVKKFPSLSKKLFKVEKAFGRLESRGYIWKSDINEALEAIKL